jgi:hypothetical protein
MTAAENGNVSAVHSMLSSQARQSVSREDVATGLSQRQLYAGYQHVTVQHHAFHPPAAPGAPDTAVVSGTFTYSDGRSLPFRARLALEEDEWRIDSLTIGTGGAE